MSLENILSVSGKPGLYKLKTQTRSGFLVESIADSKKINIGRENKVNFLSEISIYTQQGEKPLIDIFKAIATKEDSQQTISHKEENDKLISYFGEVASDYDREKVYVSDIKKVISWYNLLISKDFTFKDIENSKDPDPEGEQQE